MNHEIYENSNPVINNVFTVILTTGHFLPSYTLTTLPVFFIFTLLKKIRLSNNLI